MGKVTG